MNWKPIDFQSFIVLDSIIVDLLSDYLDERESLLAQEIFNAFQFSNEPLSSSKPRLKLSSILEVLEKSDFHHLHHSPANIQQNLFNKAVATVNKALWHYTETLEGCVTELGQQLDLISLEQWHDRLAQVVGSLKELLIHKLEDLIWAIRRLETQLWRCKLSCDHLDPYMKAFTKLSKLWESILDPALIRTLMKNQEYLRVQYQKFMKRYRGYFKLQEKVNPLIDKLHTFECLGALGSSTKLDIVKLYMLLKLWELNRTERKLPSKELDVALRNVLSVDKATELLKEYYKALKDNLFKQSLWIKDKADRILSSSEEKGRLLAKIQAYDEESHVLGALVSQYRDFLLRVDPDPYVRARLGFAEPTAGAEPFYTKPLLKLSFDVEALNDSFSQLQISVKKTESLESEEFNQSSSEIDQLLHEMGQPLSSARSLRTKAEDILEKLQCLNELGSFNIKMIDYTGRILSRLLRADWRYHVVFGIPLFHQLYATHHGLLKPAMNRQHEQRLAKFSALIKEISEWLKPQQMQLHAHDVELDMNDIKGYLQDFLGTVQRTINDENLKTDNIKARQFYEDTAQQLLEYRYIFGNFFYQLRQNEEIESNIRRQFLFVDQYFESVEQKLYELQQDLAKEPEPAPHQDQQDQSQQASEENLEEEK